MFYTIFQLWDSFKNLKNLFKMICMGKRAYKYDKVLCRKFGQNVACYRKELQITQEELAFRANISPSYLSAIERGITDTTISTAKRIAKAVHIEITKLFAN